jgi:phosphoglycolate phosphatase
MNKKLIIFDLDGTLLDSLQDIALATNQVLKDFGCDEHSTESYRGFVGDGARELVKRALSKSFSKEQIDKALVMFKKIYSNKINGNTKPFDGIYEMLDNIKEQCDLALLSNKPHKFTLEYMELFFKEYDFKVIHGQKDEIPKKPDPAGVHIIMDKLNYKASDVFFIGDTSTDMKTAKSANVIPIGVLWGYQDKETLIENGAKYLTKTPHEIVDIVTSQ